MTESIKKTPGLEQEADRRRSAVSIRPDDGRIRWPSTDAAIRWWARERARRERPGSSSGDGTGTRPDVWSQRARLDAYTDLLCAIDRIACDERVLVLRVLLALAAGYSQHRIERQERIRHGRVPTLRDRGEAALEEQLRLRDRWGA